MSDIQRKDTPSAADLEALTWLADVGELAGPLAHEMNNFLNVLLLQVAVLQQRLPEGFRADLAEIRRQGTTAAALVNGLQQYRRNRRTEPQPVDLNRVVQETAEAWQRLNAGGPSAAFLQRVEITGAPPAPTEGARVVLSLAPDAPTVLGSTPDLRRLCTFLLNHAAAATPAGTGTITVHTERAGDKVQLSVHDGGPAVPADELSELFDATRVIRPGTNSLELAACRSLVRRLRGSITAESPAAGGVVICVELPSGNSETPSPSGN